MPKSISLLFVFTLTTLLISACSDPSSPTPGSAEKTPATNASPPQETAENTENAQSYLDKANQLMAVDYQSLEEGQTDQPRQQLLSAHQAIQTAKSLEETNPGVKQALNNLETKYLSMIESAANERAYHRAKGFIEDSKNLEIDQAKIMASKKTIDKAIMEKSRTLMNRF